MLDIAADIEALLRKFNPLQPRDDDGKWTDGMPTDLVSTAIDVLGGSVTVKASRGGEGTATLQVGGRAANLTRGDFRELRRQAINAKYGDDRHAGDDGVYRVVRYSRDPETGGAKSELLVSLRPVDGAFVTETGKRVSRIEDAPEDEEVYNAEFDMVVNENDVGDFGDEPMIRVSLKDISDTNRKGIYQALLRATAARRVDTGNGPTDVFSPRAGAVGLRMKDDYGNPTEVILNARDFRRIDSAISDAMYGEGEGLDDQELALDRDTRIVVETSGGQVEVRFKGHRTDSDWVGTLTILPLTPLPWGVAVAGPHIRDFNDAFQMNGEEAGFIRASGLGSNLRIVAVRPEVRAIVRDLLRKFNPDQPRDPDGKFSKIGVIRNALAALAGDDANAITAEYGLSGFPDRDGVDANRHIEWEVDDDGNYNVTFNSDGFGLDDDAGRPALALNGQAFSNLTDQIGLMLLADAKPPFDPNDRTSVLLHSVLAKAQGAAHYNDDETYIDISPTIGGAYSLEFDDGQGDEALSMELSKDELAHLHASMLLTLMAQRPGLRSAFGSRRREFSEAKVKRDRKGRFAKKMTAAEVLGEMDALMAKLGELMKSSGVDDDEKSDLDVAMDYMKMARRSRETRGDEDTHDGSSDLDTTQYHSLEVNPDPNDGTVVIDHDSGGFWMSAADAEDMAQAIDEFDDITIPDGKTYSDVIAEKVSASGDVKAVLWGSGTIEIGGVEGFDDDENNLVIDPSDPDDARNVADALEEAAAAALKGAGK